MAVGGTTPLSNKRRRENPGNGPLGWPSDEYIQLSGGAAAAAGAGAAAGGEAAAPAGAVAISNAGALPLAEQRSMQSQRAAVSGTPRYVAHELACFGISRGASVLV